MTPEDFKRDWEAGGDTLVTFSEASVQRAEVPPEAKAFLTGVGLPHSAAPFLSFGPAKKGGWRLELGLEIGANGVGDPVGVMPDGSICYFNHDEDFARYYVNKDLFSFAETLLRFRTLIIETQKRGGSDGYLSGRVPTQS